MKGNYYIKLKVFLILLGLLFSQTSNITIVNGFEALPNNFELTYYVRPNVGGDEQRLAIAKFIQSSLLPLGIKVNLELKSSASYVFEDNGMKTYDLTNLKNTAGQWLLPSFILDYSSNSDGQYIWPIAEENFESEFGVDQSKVDSLLEELERETDLTKHKQLTNEFVELFYDTMLYEIPLVTASFWSSTWNYVKYNTPQEVFKATRALPGSNTGYLVDILNGMQIADPNNIRISDSDDETIDIDGGFISYPVFDPLQNYLFAGDHHTYFIAASLAFFDIEHFTMHPSIAKAWEVSDWDLNNGTVIPGGIHKFWINKNVGWKRNFDKLNEVSSYGKQNVTARDFEFSIQLLKLDHTNTRFDWMFNDMIDEISVNVTENSISFYLDDPKRDDVYYLSQLFPTPSFLLNQTLTYNETTSGNIFELDALGISAFDTEEWNTYELNPFTTGPFYMNEYEQFDHLTLSARDDYWFPSEWDDPEGIFALHKQEQVSPVFFLYNTTAEQPTRKPTEFFIKNVNLKQVFDLFQYEDLDDTYRELIETGLIDEVIVGHLQDFQIIEDHAKDDRFVVREWGWPIGPESLIFNIDNPHLKKINVRKAIAHALDRDALVGTLGNFYTSHNSIVWRIHEGWYDDNDGLEYDYTKARDLMREEGYKALENQAPEPDTAPLPTTTILVPEDDLWGRDWAMLMVFTIFFIAKFSGRKRRMF